jgi:hypothetical protein
MSVNNILLQPNTKLTFSRKFPICSSTSSNDGFIPFGTTISGATVSGYDSAGADKTSDLVVSATHTDDKV